MKKLLLVIITFLLCFTLVNAEDSSFLVKDVKVVKSSDGVVLNDKSNVNAIFNDLNQQIKYEATIENKSDKKLYLNFIEVENSSEKFMEYKLDNKSENKVLEPNSSSKINFYVNTLEVEGAGRNLDDNIKINFMISDKIFNPNTFSNILDLIILLVILGVVTYFVKKNKKVQTMILVIGVSIIGIEFVYANNYIEVPLPGNIKYQSQNNIISTGTTLNDKQADYTNAKEVWAYYDKVKNVEVKSLIKEPKEYYKKFDLTENKTGRVMAYLVENNDKDTPYDLKIMSKGVVIANKDSSFMFSFPNTEKVEGLTNVDFRNATTMQGMFIGNENLKKVEIEAIELSNTVDTSYMFYDCEKIEHTKDDFDLTNVINKTMMFIPYLYNEVKTGAQKEIEDTLSKSPTETNIRGNILRNDTINNKYPVYYYRGEVNNNNVKFANFCWKIVRTTETGGVKIIYNGTPNDDGTCKESEDDIIIGNSAFNASNKTLSGVGYMTNDTKHIKKNIVEKTESIVFIDNHYMANDTNEYYYSKDIKYENGQYILINPIKTLWKDKYKELEGYYTCKNTTLDGCSTIYQVVRTSENSHYVYKYSNGATNDNTIYIMGKGYKKNNDGTYSLKDIIKLTNMDWNEQSKELSENNDLYGCRGLKNETCDKINYIHITNYVGGYIEEIIDNRIYAEDVEYIDGKYVLKNIYNSTSWYKDKKMILEKYKYTCLNETKECEKVYHIDATNNLYYSSYIELSNGETIDTFLEKAFENKYDSSVKTYVENWYENNLISYTSLIEDTVWCNNRKIEEGPFSFNNKAEETTYNRFSTSVNITKDTPKIDLNCEQINDSFTVNKNNGNGKLKYPIGLITYYEAFLSGYGSGSYNYATESYLAKPTSTVRYSTMSPSYIDSNNEAVILCLKSNSSMACKPSDIVGVRPAISLKQGIKYTSGNGTKENPYVIEEIEK